MSAGELRMGQIVPMEFTVKDQADAPVDLTGASPMVVKIRKPNDEILSRNASFVNSGTDGKIFFVTQADDLDQVGEFEFQALVTLGGILYPSDILLVEVHENIV